MSSVGITSTADATPRSVGRLFSLLITGIKKASIYAEFLGYTLP